MIVVVNTTPILSLASVGRLDLLRQLFGRIILADAVYQEIKAKRGYGYEEVECDWITIQTIRGTAYRDLLLTQLDAGEAETIILAKELDADWAIIDENLGYRLATRAGIPTVRTLSILLRAKQKGLLERVTPLIDEMIAHGRWYSPEVRRLFLHQAEEI